MPAAILSGTAAHAPRPAMVGTVNGVGIQGANIGRRAEPPAIVVMIAGFGGWAGTCWLMAVCSVAGVGLMIWLRSIENRLGIE